MRDCHTCGRMLMGVVGARGWGGGRPWGANIHGGVSLPLWAPWSNWPNWVKPTYSVISAAQRFFRLWLQSVTEYLRLTLVFT